MMKLYLREEFFGSIIYNPDTSKYFNLSHTQTESIVRFLDRQEDTPEGRTLYALLVGKMPEANVSLTLKRIRNETAREKILSAPLKVFFNITKKCNLYCKHCYNDSGRPDSPELPLSNVLKTLQELERRGIFKVTLAGGEPLFHPDFDKIIEDGEKTDLSFSIVTNGICITERRAILLGQSRRLNSITVSLDGALSAENDLVRGDKAFDRALRGIALLKQHYSGSLAVRITVMRSNMDNLPALPALLSELGVHEIKVNAINAYGRAKLTTDLLISTEEYITARNQLFESAKKFGMSVEIPAQKYQRDNNDQIGLCKAGEETFEIDGDGSVYPCSFSFGHFLAGNVQFTPFDDIFRNLQLHTINNAWCYQCKGRGGKAEKVVGKVPRLIQTVETGSVSCDKTTSI